MHVRLSDSVSPDGYGARRCPSISLPDAVSGGNRVVADPPKLGPPNDRNGKRPSWPGVAVLADLIAA